MFDVCVPPSGGSHARHAILVGGLSDGLLFTSWLAPLAARLDGLGWASVQPLLSSSLDGWGSGSLDRDADEIARLARWLRRERGSCGVIILGHSTGCQDAVRYATRYGSHRGVQTAASGEGSDSVHGPGTASSPAGACDELAPLVGVALQAPVSDREAFAHLAPALMQALPRASEMVAAGRGRDIVERWGGGGSGTPVCADRCACVFCVVWQWWR